MEHPRFQDAGPPRRGAARRLLPRTPPALPPPGALPRPRGEAARPRTCPSRPGRAPASRQESRVASSHGRPPPPPASPAPGQGAGRRSRTAALPPHSAEHGLLPPEPSRAGRSRRPWQAAARGPRRSHAPGRAGPGVAALPRAPAAAAGTHLRGMARGAGGRADGGPARGRRWRRPRRPGPVRGAC